MQGTILTTIGRQKIAVASPESPVVITQIAVGDGNGGYPPLTESQLALVNEVWRGDVTFPIREGANLDVLMFQGVVPRDVGGFTIREIGIFDNTGALIAIGQCTEITKPVPTPTNQLSVTVKLRFQLSNTEDVNVIITESPTTDHRQLTFRTADNAHPASSIDLNQGRDVQEWVDTSLVVSTPSVLNVGEDNYITAEDTYTLPPTTELAVGNKVYLSKKGSINPTINVNGGNAEKVLIGEQSSNYLPYDGFIYNINAGIVLRFDGTDWELM